MNLEKSNKLITYQQNILSMIALGESFSVVFEEICLNIEDVLNEKSVKCSILLLEDSYLHHCAAPSLPLEYCQLINGVEIGPMVGSCGTAAFTGSPCIVGDISTSPSWRYFKESALKFGLKSCWSIPIFSNKLQTIGTFATYQHKIGLPTENDLVIIKHFVHLVSIVIQAKKQKEKISLLINSLRSSNEKFEKFISVMPDLALILREDGAYEDIYGLKEDLLHTQFDKETNNTIDNIFSKEETKRFMSIIRKAVKSDKVIIFEYEMDLEKGKCFFEARVKKIESYLSNTSDHNYVLWMARDITDRKKAELNIHKLAYFDPLTGLPNRRLMIEKLTDNLKRNQRYNKHGAVLFLDIDKFKKINDSLGHSAGDKALITIGNRLNSALRSSDTLARIGGDEFIILLEFDTYNTNKIKREIEVVSQKIKNSLIQELKVENTTLHIKCSIGIFLIDAMNKSLTIDDIFHCADTAMYKTKNAGGNSFTFYQEPSTNFGNEYSL